jgi:hypothetical protein
MTGAARRVPRSRPGCRQLVGDSEAQFGAEVPGQAGHRVGQRGVVVHRREDGGHLVARRGTIRRTCASATPYSAARRGTRLRTATQPAAPAPAAAPSARARRHRRAHPTSRAALTTTIALTSTCSPVSASCTRRPRGPLGHDVGDAGVVQHERAVRRGSAGVVRAGFVQCPDGPSPDNDVRAAHGTRRGFTWCPWQGSNLRRTV